MRLLVYSKKFLSTSMV